MPLNDVQIKENNLVYQGVFQLKRLQLRFRFFSGEWSPWLYREQICRQDAVSVLLFDPKSDKLVLVEQFRVGALREDTQERPWMLENVAGLLDVDEDPEQTAVREVFEEASADLIHLFPILDFYNTPGAFTEKTRVFCGIVAADQIGDRGGLVDEYEDIKIHVLPAQQVFADLEAGRLLTSASTVIGLLWLKQNRKMLDNYIK